jgi:MinD-like ATPase involved in chromosome partitioning or flagellar assembly
MLDQASKLRQLAAASGRYAANRAALPLVVVTGGESGVGTSTVARQLALGINDSGHRTLLIDLNNKSRVDANCLTGPERLLDTMELDSSGMWVVDGVATADQLNDCTALIQQQFLQQLQGLESRVDLAIFDAGNLRNLFVRRLWQAASMVVVVSRDKATSITAGYAAIKVLLAGETSVPVYTCINSPSDERQAEQAHERLHATCRKFLGVQTTQLGNVRQLNDESPFLPQVEGLAERVIAELGLTLA